MPEWIDTARALVRWTPAPVVRPTRSPWALLPERKGPLPVTASPQPQGPQWYRAPFTEPTPYALVREAYKGNGVVYACITTLARTFGEATLKAYYKAPDGTPGDPVPPAHPLAMLLKQPNPLQGQAEYLGTLAAYRALGGNAYTKKVPTVGARGGIKAGIAELWPYSTIHISPVPSRDAWVDHYYYDLGNGKGFDVPAAEIVQWKADTDPERPWLGLSPLKAVAHVIDSDNELTRMLFHLLSNDAIPSGMLTIPPGTILSTEERAELRETWQRGYGKENRGKVALGYGGLTYGRVGFSPSELDVSAVQGIFEARIASACSVPPIIAGLHVGLHHGREGNYESTRRLYVEGTLVPFWKSLASVLNTSLVPDFGDPRLIVAFDTSEVAALRENQNDVEARTINAYTGGLLTQNEARERLNLKAVPDGDTFHTAVPDATLPATDTTPTPPAVESPSGAKAAMFLGKPAPVVPTRATLERELSSDVAAWYTRTLTRAVEERTP